MGAPGAGAGSARSAMDCVTRAAWGLPDDALPTTPAEACDQVMSVAEDRTPAEVASDALARCSRGRSHGARHGRDARR